MLADDQHCTVLIVLSLSWYLGLFLGSGKRITSRPTHPAIQQPPNLCSTSQHYASNCLWPSADAPSSAQQWTLKPVELCPEDPPSTKQMGGPFISEDNGPCGILPPSKYVQWFCFFYSCVYVVQFPLSECEGLALLLRSNQAEMKSEYHICWLTQLSAFQLFSFYSYYENIKQMCTIQQTWITVCKYLWRCALPTEALWRIVTEKRFVANQWTWCPLCLKSKKWFQSCWWMGFNSTLLLWLKEDHYFWTALEEWRFNRGTIKLCFAQTSLHRDHDDL